MKKHYQLLGLLFCYNITSLAQSTFNIQNTICYCKTAGYSISNVLQADNNYLIASNLWAAPKSIDALKAAGVRYTQSQLLLLQVFKMIKKEGNTYSSNIPFLDSVNTIKVREDAKARAALIYPIIENDIIDLLAGLKQQGHTKHAFSILFSYVLDGKIWGELEKRNVIASRQLSSENPLWVGEFWSLFSPRKLKCGTNTYDGKNLVELNINWAYPAIPKLAYFFRQWGSDKLLNNLNASFVITDEKVRQELEMMQISDGTGKLRIPVIEETSTSFIYQKALKIVDKMAAQMLRKPFEPLMQEIKFRSVSQTIVISYHEIMWYLLEMLVENQLVDLPKLFTDTKDNKAEDVSSVIFLIKKNK